MPERYREAHQRGIKRLSESGIPRLAGQLLDLTGQRKDGGEFPVELTLSLWRDSKGEMYCTGILWDVTERKLAKKEREVLLQSNKNLEEFALIASHDLKEPLRKISIYGERLEHKEERRLDKESREYLERMLDSTRRMQVLIRDLLTYSRVSTRGRCFTWVDLDQIVETVLCDYELAIRDNEAAVVSENLPTIEADPAQMRQLFGNLLENALKYR